MKKTIFFLLLAVLGLSVWQLRPTPYESADWWESEAERTELSGQLDVAKFKLAVAANIRGPEELERLVSSNEERDARIISLKVKRGQLTAAVLQAENDFVKLGEDRLRQLKERAVGKEWTELAAAGRIYQDAKVVSVNDAGVTIRHRDGSARLRYCDLTDGQRLEFGLDEATSLAAVQEERKKALAYEQWLEDELVIMGRNKLEASKMLAKATRSSSSPAPIISANVAPVTRRLNEPARQVGTQYRNTSYSRPRRTSFYYYYSAPRYYCAPRYRVASSGIYSSRQPVNNPPVISSSTP